MAVSAHYIPLHGANDEQDGEGVWKVVVDVKSSNDNRLLRFIFLACVASLTCTAVNFVLLGLQSTKWSAQTYMQQPRFPTQPLEFVSPYIGLETAVYSADAPPLPPITNFPMLLAQVNASEPTRALHDKHKLDTTFGMVYPNDRRFEVSSDVSTIAEFRVVDFGMERCTLNAAMLPLAQMDESTDFSVSSEGSALVEIWRLDVTNEINPGTLSWATKPKRTAFFDRWTVKAGKEYETSEFGCAAMTLQAFEFVCVGSGCHLGFRQIPDEPRQAFYITQRQSTS